MRLVAAGLPRPPRRTRSDLERLARLRFEATRLVAAGRLEQADRVRGLADDLARRMGMAR